MTPASKPRSAIGIGITTLVTIIVAVLLTTFAVLTLVTARADLRLSNKAIESTQNYYAADSLAELWLAELDDFFSKDHEDLAVAIALAKYKVDTASDGRMLVFEQFVIDDKRYLLVEVAVDSYGNLDILTWKSVADR